ncbi:MAG: hypothetical protein ACJAZ1_000831 [Yoonia sp.]|jgi:hypothetical protein
MAGLLRTTAIQSVKLLHHRRRSANRKLHCGIALVWQSPLWAGHVGQIDIGWQDRRDAANGSSEPIKMSPIST